MRISTFVLSVGLLACTMPIDAQIVPSVHKPQAVLDQAMIFEDRGQRLEIYSKLRATAEKAAGTGVVQRRLAKAASSSPMGPQSLGVVFNHALQTQGFLTGEIAFKPKGDGLPADIDARAYPGLLKITHPHVYVTVGGSPQEFLELLRRLKARDDLEWVEAVVLYDAATEQAPTERPTRPGTKPSR